MTPATAQRISRERLNEWADTLAKVPATPFVMVAIGHGPASGEVHVMIPGDIMESEAADLLQRALVLIHRGKAERV